MALLLAILQPAALVIFQHPMFATKLALAERAVADDALGRIFAILEGATDLFGTATADGKGDVYCSVGRK